MALKNSQKTFLQDENHPSFILQKKRNKMISDIQKGKIFSFLNLHSSLYDDYFMSSFERSVVGPQIDLNNNPYAIIALGGYGRSEQCVHSDIDLLILFEKKIPNEAEKLVRELIYPLWDIGLQVGYSIRTIKESVLLADEKLEEFTTIMDARFISGISLVFLKLMNKLSKDVFLAKPLKTVKRLIESSSERHKKFGDSTYLLEPDLKNGQGGLRDYHTMIWLLRIKAGLKTPQDLRNTEYLSPGEYSAFNEALEFIWVVRNRLHILAGRKYDQLRFDHQVTLADKLKFKKKEGRTPVERFMGTLHGKMEFIKQHHLIFIDELGKSRRSQLKNSSSITIQVDGLKIEKNMINFISKNKLKESPELLIKIFRESIRLKIPLSTEAKRRIKEFGYLAVKFGSNPAIIGDFEAILVSKPIKFNVLNEMVITGLLPRIIPEFKKLINRIQYNQYHLFPVDKHSIHTVVTIKNLSKVKNGNKESIYKSIYQSLRNRKILLWAALLHDIGKGVETDDHSNTGAEISEKILKRAGYSKSVIDTVSFLIKEHLFLVNIAKRRDVNDEETAIFCARKIKTVPRLKMLYLLTVADSMSTGPKAWNEWASMLLTDLFIKVLKILEEGTFAKKNSDRVIEKKRINILSLDDETRSREDLNKFYNILTQRYLLNISVEDIIEHYALFKSVKDDYFAWSIKKSEDLKTRNITILGKDRPGLFSTYAGVFALNNIDILDAQTYIWSEKSAISIFTVKPPVDLLREKEKWFQIEKDMKQAIFHNPEMLTNLEKKALHPHATPRQMSRKPNRVEIDNDSSSFFTIIEVFAYDAPGLLFRITNALYRCELDIQLAKITTDVEQVVDVFYVSDIYGEKVYASSKGDEIREAILEMLP